MKYDKTRALVTLLACALFCVYAFLYEMHERNRAQSQIEAHSRVIADAMWNYNEQGMAEYLKLAAKSSNYKLLEITHHDGETFQRIQREPAALDSLLMGVRLIPLVRLMSTVERSGNIIGWVEADWYPRTVYIHAYVLFALTMIAMVIHLYLRVLSQNRILEERVLERTAELAESNDSLQKEVDVRIGMAEALRKYEYIVASSSDMISLIDTDLKILTANKSYLTAFGKSTEEILGTPLPELVGRGNFDEGLADKLDKCLEGEEVNFKTWYTFPVAGRRYLDITLFPFFEMENRISGIVIHSRDLTEKKSLEDQLVLAQKMEAVGTLAGGVAHDFNNLLMGISGRISIVMAGTDPANPFFDHFREIEEHVKSAAELTRLLLGYAKGGKYEVRVTDLNALITESSLMFGRTRKEIRIFTDLAGDLSSVEVDRSQIEQVLMNLYLNAWQAMPDGGRLHITSENIGPGEATPLPNSLAPGPYVKLSVTDTGIGMAPSTMERIFEPFFTTKEMGRGTGLGLASSYGIIENHGGIIDVKSRKDRGTSFFIYLPASLKKIPEKREEPSRGTVSGTETVLLVDDEEIITEVGEELLSALGYRVITAGSGTEALSTYRDGREEISMVILDMIMPGMDGGETFDRLKAMDPEVRVLLSSGYSLNDKAAEIMARGCNGFIQKPFNMDQLSGKIRDVLDSPRLRQGTEP